MAPPRRSVDWLDRCAALASGRRRLFTGGWGDERLIEELSAVAFDAEPSPIAIAWGAPRREGPIIVSDGGFDSPLPGLPEASARAHVRRLAPREVGSDLPVYVVLAASGDEGWSMRTRIWRPLVARGLCEILLLENPLYGVRRPAGQRGTNIRTVAEHLLMNVATIVEGRALVAELIRSGRTRVGISGFSMGGCMAAVVAACTPHPLATAIFAAGRSAVPIFTEGLLAEGIDFDALGGHGPGCARIAALFAQVDLDRLPAPRRPEAAVIVGGRRDGYVFGELVEELADCWTGSELRWIDSGHAGALLFHAPVLRRAAVDALSRLR